MRIPAHMAQLIGFFSGERENDMPQRQLTPVCGCGVGWLVAAGLLLALVLM